MPRSAHWMRFAARLCLGAVLLAGPVLAQDDAEPKYVEEGITFLEFQTPYIPWLFAALLAALVLLISFKDPRRTHLD